METINNAQTLLDAGRAAVPIFKIAEHPFAVIPDDYGIHDLESKLPAPMRKKGSLKLAAAASFIALVNAEKTASTRLYATVNPPSFSAIFNDHTAETGPGWRDYEASYACPLSVEWKTWLALSGKQQTQEAFAQFIEANLPDIATPPAADMLEISRSLEAKKKVNFASGIRLSNGQNELTYEEEISGTASKGKLSVPEIFTIGIPVLEGGPRYQVEARLRYRIGDAGKLAIWYELVRPHKIIEHASEEVAALIAKETALPLFNV